jgi:hypothetical protein
LIADIREDLGYQYPEYPYRTLLPCKLSSAMGYQQEDRLAMRPVFIGIFDLDRKRTF